MREYTYEIMPFDLDMYGALPPSGIITLSVDATRQMGEDDGLPSAKVYELTGGVWMVSRLDIRQFTRLSGKQTLTFRVYPLGTDRLSFIRNIAVLRGSETVAEATLCCIIVSKEERKVLRGEALSPLWNSSPPPAPLTGLPRLRASGELATLAEAAVRRSDCDLNGHLNSARYADIICESTGFWESENLMTSLQIDYCSEFLPGETIYLSASAHDGVIRGDHEGAAAGFFAKYEMRSCE